MLRVILRRLERRDEAGFTMVEMTVALMIIALAILTLGMLYMSVGTTAQLARERQEANPLANQVLEELRAMPYTTVTSGLANWGTDLSGDPNISAGHFKPAYDPSIDEVLQTYTPASSPGVTATCANQTLAPLYPHVCTVSMGKTSFKQRAYVTQVAGSAQSAYWLTAVVSWSSAATKGVTKTVALRSQLFSPAGCLSLSTHPFSGPCQAFFYGTATRDGGSINISAPSGSTLLPGYLNVTGGTISLPSLMAAMQIEQTTLMSGKALTSGAKLVSSSGTTTTGTLSATTVADTDPSTSGTSSATGSTPSQTVSTLTAGTPGQGQIKLTPTTNDTGALVGTVASSSSPACKDVDGATTISTGLPCASGNVQALGSSASTAMFDLPNLYGRQLPTMTLSSVAAAPSPTYAMTTRFTSANPTYCPTATGAGCAVSSVKRAMGNAFLGGLPAPSTGDIISSTGAADMTLPSGFSMLKLTGYTDSAISSSGVGAGTSSTTRAGTLSYWDPANCAATANYCSLSLSTAAASMTLPSVTAHYGGTNDGGSLDVSIAPTVSVPSSVPTSSGAAPCQQPPCVTTSSVSPPIVTLSYTISHLGTTIGAFSVTVDLGRLVAKSTYRAAPSG